MNAVNDLLVAVREWRPSAVDTFEQILPDFVDAGVLLPIAVDFRGCLLSQRATVDNPHLEAWFEDRFIDAQREYVLNHVHLWDAVWMPNDDAAADELTSRLQTFLPILAEFWVWHITRQSAREIDVWTADDPEEYGPTIGFGYKR